MNSEFKKLLSKHSKIFDVNGVEELYAEFPSITHPVAKPTDLGLTAREFFYWTEKGIIDVQKTEDGQSPWTKLNLLEVTWVRIVQELRRFNFPFNEIVKIKDLLFKNAIKELLAIEDSDKESFLASIDDIEVRMAMEDILSYIHKSPELSNGLTTQVPSFITALLGDILVFNRKILMHITKLNDEYFTVFEGCSWQRVTKGFLAEIKEGTHLTINLNNLIAAFLTDDKFEKINTSFGLISEDEVRVLEAIRKKEVKEIHIKKDNNDVLSITTSIRTDVRDEQVAQIKRILRMNEYDQVTVHLRNNKHIYIEKKSKLK